MGMEGVAGMTGVGGVLAGAANVGCGAAAAAGWDGGGGIVWTVTTSGVPRRIGCGAKCTLLSALRKASAVWKRCAGSLAIDIMMISFIAAGSPGCRSTGGFGV